MISPQVHEYCAIALRLAAGGGDAWLHRSQGATRMLRSLLPTLLPAAAAKALLRSDAQARRVLELHSPPVAACCLLYVTCCL